MPLFLLKLTFVYLGTKFAHAVDINSGDPCNFEVLTDSCKIFNPEGPERISLKNGSIIFNPVASSRAQSDEYFQNSLRRKIASEEKNSTEFLKVKQRLFELLKEIDDRTMHPKFKFYVVNNYIEFIEMLFDKNKVIKKEVELPWPIDNPDIEKKVSTKEVMAKFLAVLKPAHLEQIKLIYDEMKMLQVAAQRMVIVNSSDEMSKEIPEGKHKLIAKYFEFSKSRVVALISRGAAEDQLTSSEKSMIRKVKSLKLAQYNSESQLASRICLGGNPNAFFNPRDNSITLCPACYFLPEGGLIQILAHEIGHSIAPCLSQFGIYEVRSNRLIEVNKGLAGSASREITKDPSRKKMLLELLAINEKSNLTAFPFPLIASQSAIDYYVDKGVLRQEIPGVNFSDYPFKKVTQCLADRYGFRGVENQEIRRIASEVTRARADYREPTYDRAADERQIIDAISKYPGCLSPDKESQADEAMSDWISAKVLGDYLMGNPVKTNEDRLALVSSFAGLVCRQRYEGQKQKNETLATIFKNALQDSQIYGESHPPSKLRIDKIIFGDPRIRQASGCPLRREISCER